MSWMTKLLASTLFLIALSLCDTHAQHQYTTAEDSDPEATTLLELMDVYLENASRIHASFEMNIAIPGEEQIRNKGTFDQEGDKYIIVLESYTIVCDGDVRWVYMADQNEVNIYSATAGEGPSTPIDYLQLYRSQEFVYRISAEEVEADEKPIEFKPLDKYSDYTKVRLTLKEDSGRPVRVQLFEKGGTRTDLQITQIEQVKNFPQGHFVFTPSAYPDIHIEDLRID